MSDLKCLDKPVAETCCYCGQSMYGASLDCPAASGWRSEHCPHAEDEDYVDLGELLEDRDAHINTLEAERDALKAEIRGLETTLRSTQQNRDYMAESARDFSNEVKHLKAELARLREATRLRPMSEAPPHEHALYMLAHEGGWVHGMLVSDVDVRRIGTLNSYHSGIFIGWLPLPEVPASAAPGEGDGR